LEIDPGNVSVLTNKGLALYYLNHTGSTYGTFDLERMLSTLTTIKDDDKEYPAILEKGIHVLESFRLARYSIYTQVYQHHTRLIADRMFLRSLELAIFREKSIPKKLFKFYAREKQFIDEFLKSMMLQYMILF
jgi:HD superfamily phosphohydrolase